MAGLHALIESGENIRCAYLTRVKKDVQKARFIVKVR